MDGRPHSTGLAIGLVLALAGCSAPAPHAAGGCDGGASCGTDATCVSGHCEAFQHCQTDADCSAGEGCVNGICSSCDRNVRCVGDYRVCDAPTGKCVDCKRAADCPRGLPICTAAGCAQCATSQDCPSRQTCYRGRCTSCENGNVCSPGYVCAAHLRCVASCGNGGTCPGSAPICDPVLGGCGTCTDSAQCPSGESCVEGICGVAPPGDLCGSAIPVDLSSGSALLDVGLGLFDASVNNGEFDAFLKVEVPADGRLKVTLTAPVNPNPRQYAAVPTVFTGTCAHRGAIPALDADPWDYIVAAGTVYVQVRLAARDTHVRVRLDFTPAPIAPGTSCFAPIPVTLDSNLSAQIDGGPLTGRRSSAGDGCVAGNPRGWSTAYAFELPVRAGIEAVATTNAPGEGPPALALQGTDCFTPQALACDDANPPSGESLLATHHMPLDPGRYYLLAGGAPPNPAPYHIDLKATPWPTNDRCDQAVQLPQTSDHLDLKVDLTFARALGCGCQGSKPYTGQYFVLSTVGRGARSLKVDVASGVARIDVQTGCDICGSSANQTVACGDGGAPIWIPDLPAGRYIIHVTGPSQPCDLKVDLGPPHPPPANEDCSAPAAVDVSSGKATITGDTRGATDTLAECSNPSGYYGGPDVVYAVEAPGPGRLGVVLTPDDPTVDAALRLETPCSDSFSSGVCINDGGPGAAERLSRVIASFPQYLWVDETGGIGGPFIANLTYTPAPADDTCGTATAISVGATVTGDLTGASSTSGLCASAAGEPDAWYAFVAAATGTTTVTLAPTGFDGILSAGEACRGTCLGSADAAGSGQPETLALQTVSGQRYLVRVAAHAGGYGPFTLSVR